MSCPGWPLPTSIERFRRKTRQFLEEHTGHVAVEKIHRNRPITDTDLAELQRVLIETGVGTDGDMERAVEEAGSFGVFIRGLVGLDRSAAKEAFAEFLDDKRYTANQIEFVNLVIDHLTEHGVIEARRFYESPFTDLSPTAPTPYSSPPTSTASSPSSPTSGTTPKQPDDTCEQPIITVVEQGDPGECPGVQSADSERSWLQVLAGPPQDQRGSWLFVRQTYRRSPMTRAAARQLLCTKHSACLA